MDIIEIFYQHRNEEQAIPMAKYMRTSIHFLDSNDRKRDALRGIFKEKNRNRLGIHL